MIYHILAPLPRIGKANQFYLQSDLRVKKTLCGQARTSHDNRFSWHPDVVGKYEPCQECCRIRSESQKARTLPR